MKKSKIFALALAAGLVAIGILGVSMARAEDSPFYPPVIQKLTERFGLNEDEVKAVFDEAHQERRAQIQARYEERLNQAVADGELTEAQKQLILSKHEALRTEREANWETWQEMTFEERKAAKQDRQAELETWAEENGLELKYLIGGGMGKMGHGLGFRPCQ